jgi:hypothetical protein
MAFVQFWGSTLVLSLILSVALFFFLSIWSWNAITALLQHRQNEDDVHVTNTITKWLLIILFGPLTVITFSMMVWFNNYPIPTSSIILFSLAIVTFGLILFLYRREEKEHLTWRARCVMLLFISSCLLLFSFVCGTRGAYLKLKNRFDYYGSASILGYEVDNITVAVENPETVNPLFEGIMNIAWDCGDFVCSNTTTFYCSSVSDENMDNSEVLADTEYHTKFQIENGTSPCMDVDYGSDFEESFKADDPPTVSIRGTCKSEDDCPFEMNIYYFNSNSSLYTDDELNDYLQNVYWKRLKRAPEIYMEHSFRLFIASLAGFAIAANTYHFWIRPTNMANKKLQILLETASENGGPV